MGTKPLRRYHSFFKVLIDHDYSDKLLIPPAFVKHFDGKIPNKSLLYSPAERFWHVNVEKFNNRLFFKEGWSEFVKENGLELGDFLVFHYVENSEFHVELYGKTCCQKRVNVRAAKKKNIFLNVDHKNKKIKISEKKQYEIKDDNGGKLSHRCGVQNLDVLCFKVSGDGSTRASQTTSNEMEVIELESEDELSQESSQTKTGGIRDFGLDGEAYKGETRALEAAEKYIPKNPCFKCIMKKAYISRYLYISGSFFETYLSCYVRRGKAHIKLEHSGRLWFVNLSCTEGRRGVMINGGWSRFVRENAIKVGDVCVFELTEGNDLAMKVSIFRC